MRHSCKDEAKGLGWTWGMLAVVGMLSACSSTENVAQTGEVGIESRGVGQMQRPVKSGVPVQPGGAGQSTVQVPTFPQKFEVQGPESDSFGFAVTQPGPIVIDVQGQGAPVLVTLQSPGGQPITQQATGSLRMNYNVTPQDVQRGLFWTVRIRLAQPMPPQQGGRAAGTVNVQHPPANSSQVQTAVAAQQQAVQQQAAQQEAQAQQAAAQVSAQMEQAFQQRKAQFQQQQMARRSALMAQIQPQVSQLQSRMGAQVRPRGVEGTGPGADDPVSDATDEIETRALKPSGARKEAPTGVRPPTMSAMQEPISSQQALGAAGSGPPPQQVMSNPAITSLSVTQGQPGDPVMITGSSFGNGGGEIHFVVGPGLDLIAPAGAIWSDDQIFTSVPDKTGVLGFNGTVYVKRTADQAKSNFVNFRFEPTLDWRQVGRTADAQIATPGGPHGNGRDILHQNGNPFWGYKGNDHFFNNTRLKNGWVMDNGFVYIYSQRRSGAYVQEAKINTDWPYLDVRWWMDGCFGDYESIVSYGIQVVIRGPKGVPDGLVCQQAPCP